MRILDVVQGSQEWLDARANHFTASEAPAMAGVSKYQSRAELLKLKYTGVAEAVSYSQQRLFDRGHAAEAKARAIAEEIIGADLYPVTAISDEHAHLLASFDGCTMLEDVIWETKLWNEELAASVRANDLAEHYLVQMDQQLLVSGAEKCLFTCTDGTPENTVHCWHYPNEARFKRLLAGWDQFRQDLADYQPTDEVVRPTGEAPEALPALRIELTGGVQASNLPDFKARALAMIEGIKTTLATDQDFADAAETVKFLQKGEKQLEASKQAALEQTASIAALFSVIDELRETMRQKRLHLDKLVKAEKENRRLEIQQKAEAAYNAWLDELESPVKLTSVLNLAGAMRGKKTIATLQAAADDEVARAKVEAQQEAKRLADNKALIEKLQGDYAFLFNDWRDLVQKDAEFIKLQVENRIAHHKQEEQRKLDAEREKIRQEEAEQAQAEAAKAKQPAEVMQSHSPSQGEPGYRQPIDTSRLNAAADRGATLKPASQIAQPDTVTISRKEYEQLLADQVKLYVLEDAGVAHWSGYDKAMASLKAA